MKKIFRFLTIIMLVAFLGSTVGCIFLPRRNSTAGRAKSTEQEAKKDGPAKKVEAPQKK